MLKTTIGVKSRWFFMYLSAGSGVDLTIFTTKQNCFELGERATRVLEIIQDLNNLAYPYPMYHMGKDQRNAWEMGGGARPSQEC